MVLQAKTEREKYQNTPRELNVNYSLRVINKFLNLFVLKKMTRYCARYKFSGLRVSLFLWDEIT